MRTASIERNTKETKISCSVNIDGTGKSEISTGIGFFDHMLEIVSHHSLIDINLKADGDIHVDLHHTVEDVGICLGQAFEKALGDKIGIQRFAHSYVSMDEALARVVIDLSGRSYLCMAPVFQSTVVGDFPVTLVTEFIRAVTDHGNFNLHIDLLRSDNDHHAIEAIFKAFAQALDGASVHTGRSLDIPSTKGQL